MAPRLGCWLRRYYGPLRIRTATPHGLTDPFPMVHGGGQGDSGGVGAYLAVGIQRTRCHRGVVLHQRDPRRPAHSSGEPPGAYPTAPHDPARPILEIVYSDDRRPVALTGRSLEHLLNSMCHACWAAGGSVNAAKLQAFHLVVQGGRLRYSGGYIHPLVGRIPFKKGGLLLAGVPLVMGERASVVLRKTDKRLRILRAGVVRLQPSYVLALRIVLGYAVSQLDYVFAACSPSDASLQPLQVLSDAVCTSGQGPFEHPPCRPSPSLPEKKIIKIKIKKIGR